MENIHFKSWNDLSDEELMELKEHKYNKLQEQIGSLSIMLDEVNSNSIFLDEEFQKTVYNTSIIDITNKLYEYRKLNEYINME